MDKLKMHSPALTSANIDKLAELFPTVVTENLNEEGSPVRAINFDLLRQELSDHVVDGPQERYQLDWPGKRAALFAGNAPIAKTLRPVHEESVDFDTTKNLFIEGDNLDALKLLQESYLGKVQLIYIDPPYNTGGDHFVYPDDYTEDNAAYLARSGQIDDWGNRLVANLDSNGRFHSNWLGMMYPRLKLARNLLTRSGVMFISIDENEVANLVRMCEEVFGRSNVLGALPVVMNLKGNQDAFGFAETHEFVVVCLRDRSEALINEFQVDEEALLAEWQSDEYGLFKEADNLRATGVNAPREKRPNLWYPIFVDEASGAIYATEDDRPRSPEHAEVWPISPDGEELSWYWSKAKLATQPYNLTLKRSSNGFQFYKKQRPAPGQLPTKKPKSFFFKPSYSTSTATKQMKDLMGGRFFSAPKPVPFLQDLVRLGASKDSIVLDFFAGSGSLGHAVLALNAEDGGSRRFVLAQLAEPFGPKTEGARAGYSTVAGFARDRLRKAGSQILDGLVHPEWRKDVGFRTLVVDTSGMADVRRTPDELDQGLLEIAEASVHSGRSGEDLLFQVLVDWGLELSMAINVEQLAGSDVFIVEFGALSACFDPELSLDVVREMANREPLRAVFRDSSFSSDADRINAEQIFAEVSPATDVKVI